MRAYFDPFDGNPKVEIEISGTTGSSKKISALLDTGHSGSLALPVLELIEIGAKLNSFGEVEYASGYRGINYYFSVNVTLDGKTKEVQASMIENPNTKEAIAGLELFNPYVSLIDFKNKNIIFIEEEEFKKLTTKTKI